MKRFDIKFNVSLMSDSKWERLIDRLTDTFEDGIFISYKLIHSDVIHQTRLTMCDSKPFFAEPTLYREIEWIEFLHRYESYVNENNRKAGKTTYEQDVPAIHRAIQRIGEFELEPVPTGLRLHAYK